MLVYRCSFESQDRKKLIPVFEENFGFTPSNLVEEIKLKNWALRDTQIHWMAFTYDSKTTKRIIVEDSLLKIAEPMSSQFLEIYNNLYDNANHPKWFLYPNCNSDTIYYKENFMEHTHSELYLWTDKKTNMSFFYVLFLIKK